MSRLRSLSRRLSGLSRWAWYVVAGANVLNVAMALHLGNPWLNYALIAIMAWLLGQHEANEVRLKGEIAQYRDVIVRCRPLLPPSVR